jgi:hypothetical protein
MARYIDADIAEEIIAEKAKEANYQHEGEDWKCGLCMAQTAIEETPTVDVVPKSEFAILTAQNMALEIAKNDLQHRLNTYKGAEKILEDNMGELIMAAINGAKQEAAREICEEIEMYSQGLKYGTEMLGHKLSSTALIDKVLEFIAELKKKYAEGK